MDQFMMLSHRYIGTLEQHVLDDNAVTQVYDYSVVHPLLSLYT